MSHQYLYLKLLLRSSLLLELDEYELSDTSEHGLVCSFMGMKLASAFQPVLRTDGKVAGREAFLRTRSSVDAALTPDAAFEQAVKANKVVQFDRLVRIVHLMNHARGFAEHELLFLNVHPRLLAGVSGHGRTFERILHFYSVPTSHVVIEIKESALVEDATLAGAANNYRSLGYRIAVDNFGAGCGSLDKLFHPKSGHRNNPCSIEGLDWLNLVLNLRPDFVKLDGDLIRQAEHAQHALPVLRRLVSLFHGIGAQISVQNIETRAQLEIARSAGADLLQGHYFGKPEPVSVARGALCRNEHLAA